MAFAMLAFSDRERDMRIVFQGLVLGLLAGLSAGCGTVAQPIDTATEVEPSKLYAFQNPSDERSAEVAVVRDRGMNGAACDVAIYVNGQLGAYMSQGALSRFYVPAGPITLGVGPPDKGLCSGAAVRTIETTAKEGQARYYRISLDVGGIYIGPYVTNSN